MRSSDQLVWGPVLLVNQQTSPGSHLNIGNLSNDQRFSKVHRLGADELLLRRYAGNRGHVSYVNLSNAMAGEDNIGNKIVINFCQPHVGMYYSSGYSCRAIVLASELVSQTFVLDIRSSGLIF